MSLRGHSQLGKLLVNIWIGASFYSYSADLQNVVSFQTLQDSWQIRCLRLVERPEMKKVSTQGWGISDTSARAKDGTLISDDSLVPKRAQSLLSDGQGTKKTTQCFCLSRRRISSKPHVTRRRCSVAKTLQSTCLPWSSSSTRNICRC